MTIEQAIANIQGSDLGLRVYAAWWLGRFRVSDPEAVDVLILALQDEDDRTDAGGYPLRRNAARALGKLGDRRAVQPLTKSLQCSDFYVREAAAQALEALGDPACAPMLIQLLKGEVPETSPAPEQGGLTEPYDAILEALGGLDISTARPLIQPFLQHSVERVKYAAARALYQFASSGKEAAQYGDILVQALDGDDLQLRRAALADLGAIGYLGAAEAIANTLAENSLKLIALKGVLEKQVQDLTTEEEVPAEAVQVMALMDGLL
ncbi:MAG: HEAT repeat domain-containing protein [Leptolyngbyaceae cyanobacterium]